MNNCDSESPSLSGSESDSSMILLRDLREDTMNDSTYNSSKSSASMPISVTANANADTTVNKESADAVNADVNTVNADVNTKNAVYADADTDDDIDSNLTNVPPSLNIVVGNVGNNSTTQQEQDHSPFIPINHCELLSCRVKGIEWLSPTMMNEVKAVGPKSTDIDSNCERNVVKLAEQCACIFYPGRIFCNDLQLQAMLKEFSKAWGFEISREGNSFRCHFADTKKKPKTASPSKQRQSKKSAKSSIKCPFIIRFSVRRKEESPDNGDESINTNCGPAQQLRYTKITSAEYHHTCKPGAESQRYAKRKSGREQYALDDVQDVLDLMVEFGDLDTSMLRALLKTRLPHHVNFDDQFIHNFKARALRLILNPKLGATQKEVKKLMNGDKVAANEVIDFDVNEDMQQIQNFRTHIKGLLNTQIWEVKTFLDQLKCQIRGFDYRISFDAESGRPNGIVWMTSVMKTRLLRYGHLIALNYQKRKFNKLSWPYCGPVIIDGDNEIGVIAESLNLAESIDGYTFVLSSCFDMVPQFDRKMIGIIFCDEFITPKLLSNLSIDGTATLQCDHWHMMNEVWPKYFGERWNIVKGPIKVMLESKTEAEWESAYQTAKQQVQGYPDIISYIKSFYDQPEKYSGHKLRQINGNLKKLGSTAAEQNHSSVVSHLGRGASWKLQDQIIKLLDRQDNLARKKANKQLNYQVEMCQGESEFPIKHVRDDRLARDSLTRWAYEQLWEASYNAAQGFEVMNNNDGSASVKKYGTEWGSQETITIQAGSRCCCSARIAYLHQCGHEFAIDKKLRIEKYNSRWLNQKSYDLLLCRSMTQNDIPMDGKLPGSVPKQSGATTSSSSLDDTLPDSIPTPSGTFTLQEVEYENANDIYSDTDNDNNIEQDGFAFMFAPNNKEGANLSSDNSSYHDLKQAASDAVETVKGSKKLRKYAIHFFREFASLAQTGNHIAIESTIYNSIYPSMGSIFSKNTSTYADMDVTSVLRKTAPPPNQHVEIDTDRNAPPAGPPCPTVMNLGLSPLKACPLQGGPTNTRRKVSAVETRKTKSNKRQKGGGNATTTIPKQGIEAQADPISYTSTKTCSFCKQSKHTIKHCKVLGEYGELVTKPEERAEIGREIHNPAFYVTEIQPLKENCKTVVNNSFPREGMCIIIHHRYLVQNNTSTVQNARPIMHVKCTVLDNTALPMEDYTEELFTPEAVMMYMSVNSKRVVNQLKKAAAV